MLVKCTQISGKRVANDGNGTLGSQAGCIRKRAWELNDFPIIPF